MFAQHIIFSPNWQMIKEIMAAVTIPVMAKCRIGHFAEAQILEALEVDMIDESEGIVQQIFTSNISRCTEGCVQDTPAH